MLVLHLDTIPVFVKDIFRPDFLHDRLFQKHDPTHAAGVPSVGVLTRPGAAGHRDSGVVVQPKRKPFSVRFHEGHAVSDAEISLQVVGGSFFVDPLILQALRMVALPENAVDVIGLIHIHQLRILAVLRNSDAFELSGLRSGEHLALRNILTNKPLPEVLRLLVVDLVPESVPPVPAGHNCDVVPLSRPFGALVSLDTQAAQFSIVLPLYRVLVIQVQLQFVVHP